MAAEQVQDLDSAIERADAEAAAVAVKAFLSTEYTPGQLASVGDKVQALVERFRGSRENAKLAPALLSSSEVLHALDRAGQALRDAEEAKELFRALGNVKRVASCLEAAFHAHNHQMNHLAGLKAINEEVDARRRAADKSGEAAVLVTLAHAHGSIGEPYSAVKAYQRALEVYRELGDKEGEGSSLHSMAEMLRATGGHAEHAKALDAARQSSAAFRAGKIAWGEEKARASVSTLLVEAGRLEKAPNRQEALKALKQLAQAVGQRNVADAQAAEAKLNSMRDCVTDNEIIENLQPLVAKDPSTTKFLNEELGWDTNERSVVQAGEQLDGSYIKQYSHHAFYLNNVVFGMGFGPQFRSCHPFRHGRNQDYTGVSVAVLPETEAWQQELGFRPGVMDSALQTCAIFGYEPDPLGGRTGF